MARFGFKAEDLRLWSLVTATVRPQKATRPAKPAAPKIETPEIETLKLSGMPPEKSVMSVSPPPSGGGGPRSGGGGFPLTPFNIGQAVKPASGFRITRAADIAPDPIEPKRKRRISRERDPIEARLDLHGLNSIAAETRLKAFVQQAYANDYRAILVITGKGMAENGILKRYAPEWLSDPALAHIVAGISQAHARHGGSGALYVALKRRRI
ncbi:Smr/MutS family protein [Asticcacaulis sp. EMRT-3]|uniref:Smr/MutS family protein n=1 Tax=Asticcacaulis sp. EMRT-3 TaxID=3040349 RepID=UPI0024AF2E2B|nr:Smr/MutS family protein [Asticcacaulis sp. EMRT-3]MDI7776186.1 Smr/MutS family protein [Asticcacaulis sp. EMRT-3]